MYGLGPQVLVTCMDREHRGFVFNWHAYPLTVLNRRQMEGNGNHLSPILHENRLAQANMCFAVSA